VNLVAASRFAISAACAVLLLSACQSSTPSNRVLLQSTRGVLLDGVRVQDSGLDMSAFVAEMQFVYPQQSAEVVRSMMRSEFAHHEAKRLGIRLPQEAIDRTIADLEDSLLQSLGAGGDLESWSQQQHQQAWAKMRPLYRRHLADNLLYQVVLRADAIHTGRTRLWWLVSRSEEQAEAWARSLRSGRNPASMLTESLIPGPEADGSYPAIANYLPGQAGELLADAVVGQVLGPLQLPGDFTWMTGRVIEVLPAAAALPPLAVLLEDIREHPVGPLEARAWFEEMSRRYTASATFVPISAPLEAFVPIR
jgi:hypothetical protein